MDVLSVLLTLSATLQIIAAIQASGLVLRSKQMLLAGPFALAMLLMAGRRVITTIGAWRGEITPELLPELFALCVSALLVVGLDRLRRLTRELSIAKTTRELNEELAEKKRVLEHVIDLSDDGFWIFDPRTGDTWASDQWFKLLGYKREEIPSVNKLWEQNIHPEDRQRVLSMLQATIDGHVQTYHEVYRLKNHAGEYRWRSDSGRVTQRDEEGQPTEMIGVNRDITAIIRQQEELQVAHDESQRILNSIPALVFYKDTQNNMIRVNQAAADSRGVSIHDMEGHHSSEFYPNADEFYQDDLEVIRSGSPKLKYRERVHSENGERVWVQTDKIPLRDNDENEGEVTGILVVATDVTEQVKIEHQLRIAQNRLHFAIEGGNIGLWEWNFETEEGTSVEEAWYSPTFWELLGCREQNRDSTTPETFWKHVYSEDRPMVETQLRRLGEGVGNLDISFRMVRCDQQVHWFRMRGTSERFDDSISRIAGSLQDINERKLFEIELQKRTHELRSIFETWPDLFFRLNVDGTFVDYRAGRETELYVPPSEFLNRRIQDVLPPEIGKQFDSAIRESLERDRVVTIEYVLDIKGKPFWFEARLTRFLDQGVIVLVRNITEKKEAEQALHTSNDELKKRNIELDQFAYVASHDLRSPLRGIDSLAQWIAEDAADVLPEESRRHLELMQVRVKRMEGLLEGLLSYSRVGRRDGQVGRVDVENLLEELADLLSPPKGLRIEIGSDQPTFRTSGVPLKQVFLNLIGNAIKHHDGEAGTVSITVRELDDHYEWSVIDDGPGIDPKYHDRVFEMFQTLRSRDEVEGSGMGLAIVKKTVEHYGGEIAVDSEPGRGATFRFTWCKNIEDDDECETVDEAENELV